MKKTYFIQAVEHDDNFIYVQVPLTFLLDFIHVHIECMKMKERISDGEKRNLINESIEATTKFKDSIIGRNLEKVAIEKEKVELNVVTLGEDYDEDVIIVDSGLFTSMGLFFEIYPTVDNMYDQDAIIYSYTAKTTISLVADIETKILLKQLDITVEK